MTFSRWGNSRRGGNRSGTDRLQHERWVREQQRSQYWQGDGGCGCDSGCGDCGDCGDDCGDCGGA